MIIFWLYQLDYDYIKSHYRVVAVVLSKQEELDADRKAFEQIESMQSRQWNCGSWMFVILEKIKETKLIFPQGSVTVRDNAEIV